ncbi:MAG: glycosyltransferase family 2 protein [Saprospiraceae bacterium]|nr:glycosyltransferase family 2 protein [Saprospiraceae bacterium]
MFWILTGLVFIFIYSIYWWKVFDGITLTQPKVDVGKDISIIIPVKNGIKHLKTSINQILFQNYSNFEVIYVDDHSVDDSFEFLKGFTDKFEQLSLLELEKTITVKKLL